MTIAELIKELEELDGNRVVIVAADPEGNSFNPLHEATTGAFREETNEVKCEHLTAELKRNGFTQEDVGGKPCIVFWPT